MGARKKPKDTTKTALAAHAATFRERHPKLDTHEAAVLGRLLADHRATEVFFAIAPDYEVARGLILACIEAEALARTFGQRVAREFDMSRRLVQLDAAVTALDGFWTEVSNPPPDMLASQLILPDEEAAAIRPALYALRCAIAMRRRIAEETVPRLGATRKVAMVAAAEIAAIGWLAEGVRRITGKPSTLHVVTLAEIALRIEEVSEDRVRKALRTRDKREWRTRLRPFTPKAIAERAIGQQPRRAK